MQFCRTVPFSRECYAVPALWQDSHRAGTACSFGWEVSCRRRLEGRRRPSRRPCRRCRRCCRRSRRPAFDFDARIGARLAGAARVRAAAERARRVVAVLARRALRADEAAADLPGATAAALAARRDRDAHQRGLARIAVRFVVATAYRLVDRIAGVRDRRASARLFGRAAERAHGVVTVFARRAAEARDAAAGVAAPAAGALAASRDRHACSRSGGRGCRCPCRSRTRVVASRVQACGMSAQVPGRSVAPHSASIAKSQYCPLGHAAWPRLPQLCHRARSAAALAPRLDRDARRGRPAGVAVGHAVAAAHRAVSRVQACGMSAQVPVASAPAAHRIGRVVTVLAARARGPEDRRRSCRAHRRPRTRPCTRPKRRRRRFAVVAVRLAVAAAHRLIDLATALRPQLASTGLVRGAARRTPRRTCSTGSRDSRGRAARRSCCRRRARCTRPGRPRCSCSCCSHPPTGTNRRPRGACPHRAAGHRATIGGEATRPAIALLADDHALAVARAITSGKSSRSSTTRCASRGAWCGLGFLRGVRRSWLDPPACVGPLESLGQLFQMAARAFALRASIRSWESALRARDQPAGRRPIAPVQRGQRALQQLGLFMQRARRRLGLKLRWRCSRDGGRGRAVPRVAVGCRREPGSRDLRCRGRKRFGSADRGRVDPLPRRSRAAAAAAVMPPAFGVRTVVTPRSPAKRGAPVAGAALGSGAAGAASASAATTACSGCGATSAPSGFRAAGAVGADARAASRAAIAGTAAAIGFHLPLEGRIGSRTSAALARAPTRTRSPPRSSRALPRATAPRPSRSQHPSPPRSPPRLHRRRPRRRQRRPWPRFHRPRQRRPQPTPRRRRSRAARAAAHGPAHRACRPEARRRATRAPFPASSWGPP